MDYNKTIYILAAVVIVLLIACFAVSGTIFAKEDTAIKLTGSNALYDGDYFSISLCDAEGNPLANQVVYITITDANGGVNRQQVTTDGSGNGMLQLNGLTPGQYTFNVTYEGNDKYSSADLTQKIEMKEANTVSSLPYNDDPVQSQSGRSPVPGVSEEDYNKVLRLSHGDEWLAQKRAESYHANGYI